VTRQGKRQRRRGRHRRGYARVLTCGEDLTAQQDALAQLGVVSDRICVDHGLPARPASAPACVKRSPRSAPGTHSW
jgi:hypothetical protein